MPDPNSPESNPQGLDLSSPSVQFDTNAGQWVDMSKPVQGGGYIPKPPMVTDVQFLPDYDEKKYAELGVAGTYSPETAENISETQMVDIAGGKQIPLKQWVAMSPMERLMTRGDISAMQGLGAGSPKFAIESSPLMQKVINAGLETLDTGEMVYKYDYSRMPSDEQQVVKTQGIEGWKNTYTIETGYIDPITNQPERIRRELWNTLDDEDRGRIRDNGLEAVLGGGELFPADFKANNILLDNGEWVDKNFFNSLTPEQQQFIKVKGIEAFNSEYNKEIDSDTARMYVNALNGDWNIYKNLATTEERATYLNKLQEDYNKQFVIDSGGDINLYNSFTTDRQRNDYINQLSNQLQEVYQQQQSDIQILNRYIDDNQITVDNNGNYNFSGLTGKDLENPTLVSSLRRMFPTDKDGNTIDVVSVIAHSYPSYLDSEDDMTDAMKKIRYYNGVDNLSLFGKTPQEKFELWKSWGLIPLSAQYKDSTESMMANGQIDVLAQQLGISVENAKKIVQASGDDWMYGYPIWNIQSGFLNKETIDTWKDRSWESLRLAESQGTTKIDTNIISNILNERYGGKSWDDLTSGQRANILGVYYAPSIAEQIGSGYGEAKEALGYTDDTGTNYIGLNKIEAAEPTGFGSGWTKAAMAEDNIAIKAGESIISGVAKLLAGAWQIGGTLLGASQAGRAGNYDTAINKIVQIPKDMAAALFLDIPEQIYKDPVLGIGEAVGMFLVPELGKGMYRNIKASVRAVDPRFGSSAIYSTDPNIRFYRGSPYMTPEEMRNAFQGLQEIQRRTTDAKVISEVVETKLPDNIIEGRYTKVGNEYVIDGTKIDANGNLIELRPERYHPATTMNKSAGMLRDTAKIIIYHVLPDGTKEYLVLKDRAGGDYQLAGGGLELGKGSALQQVLEELLHETNLKIKNIKELQPYLGKFHGHAYNGTRIFLAEVADKKAFNRMKYAGNEVPEVESAIWLNEKSLEPDYVVGRSSTTNVNVLPATFDILRGVGVKNDYMTLGSSMDKIADTTRDLTWGERIKADRPPTESDILASALKDTSIKNGKLTTVLFKTLTPANIERPIRLWHFTADYTSFTDKIRNTGRYDIGKETKYKSFYTTPEAAVRYAISNISKEAPELHRPALVAIDVLPSELAKLGQEVTRVFDKYTGQYVWKIANAVVEDEITFMGGAKFLPYKPNLISKIISHGDFKDITSTSITDNPASTTPVSLKPLELGYTGKLTSKSLSNINKVVFDLDDTLINSRTGALLPNAIELLSDLRSKGKSLALWTHSPKARVQAIFRQNPELAQYFDINNKQSVVSRENYALDSEINKFKDISKIKGDILIDNSGTQIYEQIKHGNVALQPKNLLDIKYILDGDFGDRIYTTRTTYEVPRSVLFKQGQKLPVMYLKTEAFDNALKELKQAEYDTKFSQAFTKELAKERGHLQGTGLEDVLATAKELKNVDAMDRSTLSFIEYEKRIGLRDANGNPITPAELYRLKYGNVKQLLEDAAKGKFRIKQIKISAKGYGGSPFKNISTSVTTKVDGLSKSTDAMREMGKKAETEYLKKGVEDSKNLSDYERANEKFQKEMEKIREEDARAKSDVYKIGVGEGLLASSLSVSKDINSDIEKANEAFKREMVKIQDEINRARYKDFGEYKPLIEATNIETATPESLIPESTTPETKLPEVGIAETGVPEGGMPEGGVPEGGVPEGGVPEGGVPEGATPEGGIPEGGIPEGGIYDNIPPTETAPYKIKVGDKLLTREQLLGAVGWKQGFMYKYIYPPFEQEDIINSLTPIQGIPIKEGIHSAYESIIRTQKGHIPPTIRRDMGIMDITIKTSGVGGKPKIFFSEDKYQSTKATRSGFKKANKTIKQRANASMAMSWNIKKG